ncbi:hypothetical protein Hanom_Chr03g00270311 [Helianthus anomalus]
MNKVLTPDKLGGSLERKRVKRIKHAEKSKNGRKLDRHAGSRDGPAGKWFPPRHATEDIARGATCDNHRDTRQVL